MILTAQQIIDQALALIGVKSTGSVITPEEYQDCLMTMNLLIDRWNLVDLLVYATNPHTFAFVQGQQKYTLGSGGDFDIPRPSKIDRISVLIPGSNNQNVELGIDQDFSLESWQNIVVKNTPSQFPLCCYNNTGFPYMELNFWPIPSGPSSVVLYTWDLLPFINNLTDNVELPTGYTDAVIYNLAVRLAQLFDRVPSQSLVAEAKQALHDINDINSDTPVLHVDPMWLGGNAGNNNLAARSRGYVVL